VLQQAGLVQDPGVAAAADGGAPGTSDRPDLLIFVLADGAAFEKARAELLRRLPADTVRHVSTTAAPTRASIASTGLLSARTKARTASRAPAAAATNVSAAATVTTAAGGRGALSASESDAVDSDTPLEPRTRGGAAAAASSKDPAHGGPGPATTTAGPGVTAALVPTPTRASIASTGLLSARTKARTTWMPAAAAAPVPGPADPSRAAAHEVQGVAKGQAGRRTSRRVVESTMGQEHAAVEFHADDETVRRAPPAPAAAAPGPSGTSLTKIVPPAAAIVPTVAAASTVTEAVRGDDTTSSAQGDKPAAVQPPAAVRPGSHHREVAGALRQRQLTGPGAGATAKGSSDLLRTTTSVTRAGEAAGTGLAAIGGRKDRAAPGPSQTIVTTKADVKAALSGTGNGIDGSGAAAAPPAQRAAPSTGGLPRHQGAPQPRRRASAGAEATAVTTAAISSTAAAVPTAPASGTSKARGEFRVSKTTAKATEPAAAAKVVNDDNFEFDPAALSIGSGVGAAAAAAVSAAPVASGTAIVVSRSRAGASQAATSRPRPLVVTEPAAAGPGAAGAISGRATAQQERSMAPRDGTSAATTATAAPSAAAAAAVPKREDIMFVKRRTTTRKDPQDDADAQPAAAAAAADSAVASDGRRRALSSKLKHGAIAEVQPRTGSEAAPTTTVTVGAARPVAEAAAPAAHVSHVKQHPDADLQPAGGDGIGARKRPAQSDAPTAARKSSRVTVVQTPGRVPPPAASHSDTDSDPGFEVERAEPSSPTSRAVPSRVAKVKWRPCRVVPPRARVHYCGSLLVAAARAAVRMAA
jgi:hypothetical protein